MKQVSIALAPLASLPPPSHLSSYILSLSCLAEGKLLIGVKPSPQHAWTLLPGELAVLTSFISPLQPWVCGKNLAMGSVSTLLRWAQEVGFSSHGPREGGK